MGALRGVWNRSTSWKSDTEMGGLVLEAFLSAFFVVSAGCGEHLRNRKKREGKRPFSSHRTQILA